MRVPLLRRRQVVRPWHHAAASVAAVGTGLVASGLFLAVSGSWGEGGLLPLLRPLGSPSGWAEVVVKATPVTLAATGVALAFHMRLWNIGAEGQFHVGAVAATYAALKAPGLGIPRGVVALILSAVAGGLWGVVPGVLKAWWGVSEIVVGLMATYVAVLWVDHLCYGPWKGATTWGFPMTDPFPPDARLPVLPSTRAHAGALLALAAVVATWILLWRTGWGFRVRVAGANPKVAEYAGYPVRRHTVVVMALAGALAGLAGGIEMTGVLHRLQPRFSPGYGYTAILVAWLARSQPLALVPVAVFVAGLLTGGEQMQVATGVKASVAEVVQGLILLATLAADLLVSSRIVVRPSPVPPRDEP